MSKSRKIIFIGGIHGVGKSTFIETIRARCSSVEGLSCSTILKWQNPAHKQVESVEANQNRLLANLPYFINEDKAYLLDGHFCLLTEQGKIERVPLDVFETIKPDMILLLEEKPMVICKRLAKRDSASYTLELVSSFLNEEHTYAQEVADALGIPVVFCNSEKWDSSIKTVLEYLK